MKDKILILIAGILVGAIITTGIFMVFSNQNDAKRGEFENRKEQMGNFMGEPPQRQSQTEAEISNNV